MMKSLSEPREGDDWLVSDDPMEEVLDFIADALSDGQTVFMSRDDGTSLVIEPETEKARAFFLDS